MPDFHSHLSALLVALTTAVSATALAGCAGGMQSTPENPLTCGGSSLGSTCIGIQSSGAGSGISPGGDHKNGVQAYLR